MEFPSSIHSPKLIGSAGLIARYEARTITEQPAIVLVAPSAQYGAVSLDAAHKALVVLRQDGLPLAGCPSIIDYQETPDDGALLALGVRGAPLALNWPDDATEVEVLELAVQQVKLLAALHQARFSGLQPGFEDLRWDSTHKSLMLLGWEWVRENEESQREDLQAAAALWVELLTGAAPPVFPPLTPETKGPAWQRVSLGTRALLSSILLDAQATATAEYVHTQLEAIHRNWGRPVDDLLSEGLDLLAREQFPAAQALFDLAARREPESKGASRLQGTRETVTTRFNRLINDVRIGSYYPTEAKFLQMAERSGITAQERLRAWRWWTMTDTLWRLSPAQTPDASGGHEKLAAALLEALDSIDRGHLKAALQQLQRALAEWGEDQPPGRLGLLEVDLRVSLRMENAVNRLLEDPPSSVDLFEQAVSDMAVLPAGYRAMLESQIGDPSVGLWQARQKIDRADLLRRTVNEARAAFKTKKFAVAQDKWNAVLRLMDRQDPKRSQYHREIRRVQLRSNAVAAGVAANLKHMDQGAAWLALEALSALRAASARDRWGLAQDKRWQEMVMSYLESDPVGPAGGWLVAYWSKDPDVQKCLQQVAPRAIAIWEAKYAEIRDDEPPRTPQRIAEHRQRLDTILASLAPARRWIEFSGSEEEYNNLYQTASRYRDELRGLAAAQSRLRTQYQAAIDAGVPPVAVLAEAEQLGVELFDDADWAISSLRTVHAHQAEKLQSRYWHFAISYADAAWRSGAAELASQYYDMVLEDTEAPESVHKFCVTVKEHLSKGHGSPVLFNVQYTSDGHDAQPTEIETSKIMPKAIAELDQLLQELRQWLIEARLSRIPEDDELVELERARALATSAVRKICVQVIELTQQSHFHQATWALDKFVEDHSSRLNDLDKRCLERHRKHLGVEREKRKEVIRTLVANCIVGNERCSDQEVARVEKELDVYKELVNNAEAEKLRTIWKNRPGTPGRVVG